MDAETAYEKLVCAAEGNPSAKSAQVAARAARRLRKSKDALHWYTEAFRRDPKDVGSILGLASLALENGSNDSARVFFEKAREIAPAADLPKIEAALAAVPG